MRKYLFEFEDLPWFPDGIRRSMVDYLRFFLRQTDYYKPIVPLIAECLQYTDTRQIIDLCSGGGGPMIEIQKNLRAATGDTIPVILTDRFPNTDAYRFFERESGGGIRFEPAPVDATDVPRHLKGVRTNFSAFHHFSPAMATKLLADAISSRSPIAIFDGGDKNMFTMLGILLIHPFVFLFCTPFFRPFRLSRLLFTYLIPVIPVCTIWDGIVSIANLYLPKQLDQLVSYVDDGTYVWKTGIKRHWLGFGISYLVGCPKVRE